MSTWMIARAGKSGSTAGVRVSMASVPVYAGLMNTTETSTAPTVDAIAVYPLKGGRPLALDECEVVRRGLRQALRHPLGHRARLGLDWAARP